MIFGSEQQTLLTGYLLDDEGSSKAPVERVFLSLYLTHDL